METNDWRAFNLATDALRDIDRFAKAPASGRPALLDARTKLKAAATRDPQFLRAKYYGAVVADMMGKPIEAIQELTELLAQSPQFIHEAEYNLAVSHYHMFSVEHIREAIVIFEHVASRSTDATLKYMSYAGLVRAFAMMVLHSRSNAEESRGFVQRAVAIGSELLSEVRADTTIDRRTRTEIEWRALNGRGVARMFASDASQPTDTRVSLLNEALSDFRAADSLSPDNWEIVCNLGSSYMRLGSIARTEGHERESNQDFELAQKFLRDVVERIFPRYGFAVYELGRTHRLRGDFASALTYFRQALEIPEDDRNVSANSVSREIERTLNGIDTLS
jgi:tetratricopeptide (TPR) repeat protein